MKSPIILNKVKDELNLPETAEDLKEKITVISENESQIVSISATDKDYSKAADIANTVVAVFQRDIDGIMGENTEVSLVAKATPNIRLLPSARTRNSTSPFLQDLACCLAQGLHFYSSF